jgi:hypothetical protein
MFIVKWLGRILNLRSLFNHIDLLLYSELFITDLDLSYIHMW